MKRLSLFLFLILWLILDEITSPGHFFYFLSFFLYIPFFYALYLYKHKWWQIVFLFGLTYNLIYFRWLVNPFQYTDTPFIVAFIVLFLMAFALTCFLIIFSFFYVKIFKFKYSFFVATIFTCLEIIKGVVFTGFPWGDLSYNFASNIYFIQIASVGGSYFITFIIILINLLLAEALFFKNFKNLIISSIILLIFFSFNYFILQNREVKNKYTEKKVLVVQGNVPEKMKFNENNAEKIFDIYKNLTEKYLNKKVDLIVWPESIYIKFLNEDKKLLEKLRDFITEINTP